MGGKNTKTDDMPSDLKSKAIQLFKAIDTDCSGTIDYKEVLKFWGNNFAIINAQNLFQSVDKDDSKSIELCEWIEFWFNVLKSGHKKEDIIAELDTILHGGSWVKFEDVDDLNVNKQNIIKNSKSKGKY